jgi:hypothetical protein
MRRRTILLLPGGEGRDEGGCHQRVSMIAKDSDALLKGGLTAEQEKEIKKNLGI